MCNSFVSCRVGLHMACMCTHSLPSGICCKQTTELSAFSHNMSPGMLLAIAIVPSCSSWTVCGLMQYMIPEVAPQKIFLGIHVWGAWST